MFIGLFLIFLVESVFVLIMKFFFFDWVRFVWGKMICMLIVMGVKFVLY